MRSVQLYFLVFLSFLFLTVGCGGGGGGSSAPPAAVIHAPGISNLQFSPSTTTKGAGGGAISVTGSFNFTDSGGDLTGFTITNYYSNGQVASAATVPISGTGGVTVGSVALYLNVATTVADNFRFEAYATDTAGSKSNLLSGTFLITDNTPTTHPPSISNFQFTPASVTQGSSGGYASVIGKFNFIDAGGDMLTATFTFYNSAGAITGTNTGSISGIAGITSGWVQSTFTASTSSAGSLRMDVYTTDSKGSNSNTLSQVFIISPAASATPTGESESAITTKSGVGYQFMTVQGAWLISNTPPTSGDTMEIQANSSTLIK